MKTDQMQMHAAEQPRWPWLLALLACVCLVTSLGRYFAGNLGSLATVMLLFPAACAFAGVVLLRADVRKRTEFRILLALLALTFISSALNEKFYGVFVKNRDYIGAMLVSVFVCYALCFALQKEKRLPVLHICIGVCAAIVTAVSLWGLVLAASGTYYMPRFQPEYGIGLCPPAVGMGADYRLVTFTHPNSTGMICEIVLLLSVYRLFTARKKAIRVLYAISAVVCFLAVSAASSRTSSLAVSVGLAMLGFRLLYQKLSCKGNLVRWGLALLIALAVAVGSFLLMDALYDGMLSLSPAGRSEAAAMTDAERVIADETSAFSGRTDIWSGVLKCMVDTPRLFAFGTSPVQVGQVIASYSPIWVQEVHSSFVQMLISCGVLCPLLFAAFVALLAASGLRLFFAKPDDGEEDVGFFVPVLVAVLISACMETFLLLYPQLHFANLWFFLLAGYTFCLAGERKHSPV